MISACGLQDTAHLKSLISPQERNYPALLVAGMQAVLEAHTEGQMCRQDRHPADQITKGRATQIHIRMRTPAGTE
jgi:hypothetical protein